MITKQSRTKLDLIRIEGICRMLFDSIEYDTLKNKIENVTGSGEIKDIKQALFRMPRYQLIKIIEITPSITTSMINEAYEQYRYGLKPGFTLFSITGTCKNIKISDVEDKLKELLSEVKYADEGNYKNLKYKDKVKIDENVYEFCFVYLSKYSYISETEEPNFIYELEECFVWISIMDKFIAIKSAPNAIINIIKRIFSNIYNAHICSVKLTKKLINEIFGENKMRKGTFYKPTAGIDEAEKVTVADPYLSEKSSVRERFEGYDITSSHLNEEIDENTTSTLGINCNKGKIYITKNLNASLFRSWSVKRIKDIISYLRKLENTKDFEIFKAKNMTSDSIWGNYNSKQKMMIENIMFSVFIHKLNGIDSFQLNYTVEDIFNTLFDSFYKRVSYNCEICDDVCSGYCSNCGNSQIVLAKNGALMCNSCGSVQKDNYTFQCDEGHESTYNSINEFIILIPNGELLRKIYETIGNQFSIKMDSMNESFYIQENTINFLSHTKGEYIPPEDIIELKPIANREISEARYEELLDKYISIKEKCKKTSNKDCNKCLLSDRNSCIMKIFTVYDGFRPSPHHGQEFGDINFEVTYKQQTLELVGIAKSRNKDSEVLNLSDSSARELIQQFLSMTHDKRVGIISAVCPMRFHEQLVQELKYVSRLSGAKMTIFDDIFMTKLLDCFIEKNKLG